MNAAAWTWAQWTIVVLGFVSLGLEMARHGQKKTGEHNFWVSFFSLMIAWSILWAGGFWK